MIEQKRRPPNNPKLGEDRVCRCGTAYYVPRAELTRRKGTSCSNECAMALKRSAGIVPFNPTRFNRTVITPKAVTMLPINDTGGSLRCARCARERMRGQRCSCERPMREDS